MEEIGKHFDRENLKTYKEPAHGPGTHLPWSTWVVGQMRCVPGVADVEKFKKTSANKKVAAGKVTFLVRNLILKLSNEFEHADFGPGDQNG